jgi:hypothetical protein
MIKDYGLIKNTLPDSLIEQIKLIFSSNNFLWKYNGESYPGDVSDEFYQFVHLFAHSDNKIQMGEGTPINQKQSLTISPITTVSNFWHDVKPIMYFFEKETGFKIKTVKRVKANLTTRLNLSKKEYENTWHIDMDKNPGKKYISMVYYVIDSDGDTILFNEDKTIKAKSSPIAGNMFWFDSTSIHTATPPSVNKIRIIINFVFEVF